MVAPIVERSSYVNASSTIVELPTRPKEHDVTHSSGVDISSAMLAELVPLMVNIKYLTLYQTKFTTKQQQPSSDNFHNASLDVKRQINILFESQTSASNIEKCSLLATITYLDFILLDIPPHKVLVSETARQLQQALTHPRSEKELKDNKSLLDWISITAATCFGFEGDYKPRLVGSFEKILGELEERYSG